MDKSKEFSPIIETLLEGMDSFLSTKTVVGEAREIGGVTIVPLINVSFGLGAGTFSKESKTNGGGGLGGKMSPNALLIISDDDVRLMRIQSDKNIDRVLELAPVLLKKIKNRKKDDPLDDLDISDFTDENI
jgi:uncharacterized spore protein YtfJ